MNIQVPNTLLSFVRGHGFDGVANLGVSIPSMPLDSLSFGCKIVQNPL